MNATPLSLDQIDELDKLCQQGTAIANLIAVTSGNRDLLRDSTLVNAGWLLADIFERIKSIPGANGQAGMEGAPD